MGGWQRGALAERFERDRGGVPARRAIVRWAWRLFRHDWRQQALVLGLLTVAVAAAIVGVVLTYHLAPATEADFGSADLALRVDGSDRETMDADLAAAEAFFGTTETIGHSYQLIPGSVETVELRGQRPDGPYGTSILALQDGRYPSGAQEIAVTDEVAEVFGVDIGDDLALEEGEWSVVGLVENPRDLEEEFALVDPDHAQPQQVTVLVESTRGEFRSFLRETDSAWDHSWRDEQKGDAATTALGLSVLGMILIGLVGSAAFVVVAQRRQRQLGMIAAIGATQKHLRLVTLANGAVIGTAAAALGAGLAVLGWLAVADQLEPVAQQRIDRFDLPWRLVVQGMILLVVTATVAAWWPARVAARIPITQALSARPARQRPARRSALLAVILLLVGVASLVQADQTNGLLITVGTLAIVLGVLCFSPIAIQAVAYLGKWSPVSARLALRDLARYQTRSSAALAAISLALGIPASIVVTATAAEHHADEGNLSDRQLMIRIQDVEPDDSMVPIRSAAELENLQRHVDRFAALLDDPTVVALEVPVDPDEAPVVSHRGGEGGQPGVPLGFETDKNLGDLVAYLATPEMLRLYGVDPSTVSPETEVLTVRSERLYYLDDERRQAGLPPERVTNVEDLDTPPYTSAPNTLITPDAVSRHGWETMRTGWFVESREPLTSEQRQAAREMAAATGLTIERRDDVRDLPAIRNAATALGLFLALGILAMTVGLIRTEAAADVRTLAAIGATSFVRRALNSATAGALALLGALLGIAGAYVALSAGFISDLDNMSRVPAAHLLVIAIGVPLLACSAGWLLGGRGPASIARRPIE